MAMAREKSEVVAVAVFVLVVAIGGGGVGVRAEHHVVGGDRGWEASNTILNWSSRKVFRIGDIVWFTYSAAHDSIVELGSLEEYLSCDLTNPIRMYTDGLDKISLDAEGIRYFASGNIHNCKNGLKLHVNVQPQAQYPLMGPTFAPTPSPAPTESPYPVEGDYWPNNGGTSFLNRLSGLLQSLNGVIVMPVDTQAQNSQMGRENGLRIKAMLSQKKLTQTLSADAPDGPPNEPMSRSAPVERSGLFGVLGLGLLLLVIGY